MRVVCDRRISEGTRGYPNFIPAIGGNAKGGGSVPQVPRQLRAKFLKSTSGSWDHELLEVTYYSGTWTSSKTDRDTRHLPSAHCETEKERERARLPFI